MQAAGALAINATVLITHGRDFSRHEQYAAEYVAQAGVKVTALRLGGHGICGNGHMVMLE